MSASLPGSSEPLVAASPCCSAPKIVIALSPSIAVTRSSAPMSLPSREMRFTADHSMNIWSSGATTKSVWLDGRRPIFIAVCMGEIVRVCVAPRLAVCVSAK